MRFTSILVLLSLTVSSLCTTVADVTRSISLIDDNLNAFLNAIEAFPPIIGLGTVAQAQLIHTAQDALSVTITLTANAVQELSSSISEEDGQNILAPLEGLQKRAIQSVNELALRKGAIAVLFIPGLPPGVTPIVIVTQDFLKCKTVVNTLKTALQIVLPSPSLRNELDDLANPVLAALDNALNTYTT